MAICRASSYLSFLAATTSSNPSAASFATRRTSPLVSVDGSFSHIQNLCAHHEKSIPDLLQTLLPCRSLLSNCFILFLSGIMARAPAALADTDVGFRYPCEDVSSYYSGIDGLNGAPLMKALSSVVSNHRSLRYKDVWDALKVLDAANSDNPEASSEVIEIYTLKEVEKSLAGKPKGWNREHLWPRSYGLKDCTSLTDLHNIRPADVNVNSSRGNKYYGECISISIECIKPANPEASPDTEADRQRWLPPMQVRGDIARSLMYMAVRYGFDSPDGSHVLRLSDSPSSKNREMGLLSALLHWNKLDPPSRTEQLRNDRICRSFQHNRNPFIDHPEFADRIWEKENLSSHISRISQSISSDERTLLRSQR